MISFVEVGMFFYHAAKILAEKRRRESRARRYTIFEPESSRHENQISNNLDDHNLRRRPSVQIALDEGWSIATSARRCSQESLSRFAARRRSSLAQLPGMLSRKQSVAKQDHDGPLIGNDSL